MESDANYKLLCQAVEEATPDTLRKLLKTLFRSNESARKDAEPWLLAPSQNAKKRRAADDDLGRSREENQKSQPQPELTCRYRTCETCEVVFDVTENEIDSCQTHPGTSCIFDFEGTSRIAVLQWSTYWLIWSLTNAGGWCTGYVNVDADFFEDDDIITWGTEPPPDDWTTHWYFDELPEGFIYDCCQRRANEEPCVIQKHTPAKKHVAVGA